MVIRVTLVQPIWNGKCIKKQKSKTVLSAGGCLAKVDADEMYSLADPILKVY